MGKLSRKRNITGLCFIIPSLLGIMVFYIVPFMGSLYYTFTAGITEKRLVGFGNFTDIISSPTFRLAVKNTAIFMGIGVPVLFFLSLFLSIIMLKSKFVIERFTMLTPLIVPMAAVVSGFRLIVADDGLLNQLIIHMGFRAVNLLGEDWAMAVAIAIFVWKNVGYMAIILTSAIVSIPNEYNEVFLLESNSRIKQTFMVTIPLITPMVFFAVVISVVNSFKIFREIYIMFGSSPPKSLYMLQHFMNNNFFKLNYQRLSTAAFLLTGVLSIFIWLFLHWQKKYTRDMN